MNSAPNRPLSPHLGAYKWRYTFFNPSVIHRATGVTLSVGFVLFVYFLHAIARGPEAYSSALVLLSHPIVKVIYIGLAWSFFFHLLNGVRHLIWDIGYGFELKFVAATGVSIYVLATVLTAGFSWAVIF